MILFETIVAALCIANLNCADSEEYSLGQENKLFVIEGIANSENQEENKEMGG